jgi:hypothetical protein
MERLGEIRFRRGQERTDSEDLGGKDPEDEEELHPREEQVLSLADGVIRM